MAGLAGLPPELVLYTVSFLTRPRIIDLENRLAGNIKFKKPELVPDLPSINALSRLNTIFHHTLDQTLYKLCACVDALGKLALLFAVEHQLESTVDKLVAAGVSLDAEFVFRHSQCSLLHGAAGKGLEAMVSKLLELYGEEMTAKVYAREYFHRTALDYAVLGGHLEVVRLLAPIPIPSYDSSDPGFETHGEYLGLALIESVQSGNKEISEHLLQSGADPNFLSSRYSAPTPLHYAVDTGNVEIVQLFLASGANPNTPDTYGVPPLFKAYAIEVAQVLLDAGANIHALDEESCNVVAHIDEDADLLYFYLARGVDPNHADVHQRTPLHRACQGDFGKGSVELLLKFGATTVEKADSMGSTPVDIAMTNHNAGTVKILEPLVQSPLLKGKIATWWEELGT